MNGSKDGGGDSDNHSFGEPGAGDIWALTAGSMTGNQMPSERGQQEDPGEDEAVGGSPGSIARGTVKKEGKVRPSKGSLGCQGRTDWSQGTSLGTRYRGNPNRRYGSSRGLATNPCPRYYPHAHSESSRQSERRANMPFTGEDWRSEGRGLRPGQSLDENLLLLAS